ncbi:MAG: chemotaxis protein CheB, partial [Clostridiales bacterium]|nr:chemotaxis protein CheB [Clostridiales bacterium]
IASSTGGTEALEKLLTGMPTDCPPILIVQHMISGFTKIFAERLNSLCKMKVAEAKSGDLIKEGQVLIAPSDYHMKVVKRNSGYFTECFISEKMHGVMPAADILFFSMAECFKSDAVGVVLTGMGADGALGALKMRQNGAKTICQNKETCVVYGMPKAAKEMGAIDYELPIGDICKKALSLASK